MSDWADEKARAVVDFINRVFDDMSACSDGSLPASHAGIRPLIATALREAHEAGRREGIGEAVGIVDASADELRNAADQWDVRCVGQDAERIGADYRAREQHDRFLATALRALAEEGRE